MGLLVSLAAQVCFMQFNHKGGKTSVFCSTHLRMQLSQCLGFCECTVRLIQRALMHAGMEKETAQKEYVTLVKSLQEKYAK